MVRPSEQELVRCLTCGRIVVGYVPSMGDGSQLNARYHKRDGSTCPGSGREGHILTTPELNALNGEASGGPAVEPRERPE